MAQSDPSGDRLNLIDDVIRMARRAGADAADALALDSWSLSCTRRLGRTEDIGRAEATDIGLRVLIGRKQATVSSTDLEAGALAEMVERAVTMAKEAPEDRWCGLADPDQIVRDPPALALSDDREPSAEELCDRAAAAEDAARAVPGITNSEGADASWSKTAVALAASNGFGGAYTVTRYGISAAVLAGTGTGMERDYDWHSACFDSDLRDPATIGQTAGERAVARLNPRKADTAAVPVVFDSRVSGSLLRSLAGALSGPAIARKSSFLKDAMGTAILAPGLTVIDDPLRQRGLRSRPFDAEGLPTARRALVEDGILQSWILDLSSARQLGLDSTGNASRGTSGPPSPSPSNLYLEPGTTSRDDLIAGIDHGLLVTEMMGMGVNMVTGDYSRGAAGFWIEKGVVTHAVSEVTIAGNLKEMFRQMTPADDLEFRSGVDCPTLRIDGMTVAGR